MKTLIESYITQFSQLFDGDPWVGESFTAKLGNLSPEEAFHQPFGKLHSAAEVVAHIIAWRNEELRRLATGGERRLHMESPENWPSNESLRQKGWQHLYDELKESQRRLIAFLKEIDDAFLLKKTNREGHIGEYFIAGLLQHDWYHLGQIGIILKGNL
jgi:uncharacterized damage-inducible protein DinB